MGWAELAWLVLGRAGLPVPVLGWTGLPGLGYQGWAAWAGLCWAAWAELG